MARVLEEMKNYLDQHGEILLEQGKTVFKATAGTVWKTAAYLIESHRGKYEWYQDLTVRHHLKGIRIRRNENENKNEKSG